MGGNHSINLGHVGGDWAQFIVPTVGTVYSLKLGEIFDAKVEQEGEQWTATLNGVKLGRPAPTALDAMERADYEIVRRISFIREAYKVVLGRHKDAEFAMQNRPMVAKPGEGCMSFTLRDGTVVRPGDTVGVIVGGIPDYGPVPILNRKD